VLSKPNNTPHDNALSFMGNSLLMKTPEVYKVY